ncbi:TonB-dependent receptor [Beggiatoa leptomitoformis]|uniref:TonB-dependent receptor n=1 Tax=Beggiatoa leptomitoformis TaxID=288004 RepID=A0A2N9YE87_9GAMM|nr:TonB-dependent receptor [Beggiatoa leptomitoformis]ALG68836.1 TonB-dependent receptor [Beggiatoa leptomitoformis]AUI68797.2 TonB-dependent receptor [Beggiatoa leptomitoformis]
MQRNKLYLIMTGLCLSPLTVWAEDVQVLPTVEVEEALTMVYSSDKTILPATQAIENNKGLLSDVVKQAVGVSLQGSSEVGKQITIRGRGLRGTAIYQDGIRINELHDDPTNLVNIDNPSVITVYRGASAAYLGQGALGGAVVVEQTMPRFAKLGAVASDGALSINSSFGSQEGIRTALNANVMNDHWSLSVAGSASDFRDYEDANDNLINHTDFDSQSINVRLAYQLQQGQVLFLQGARNLANTADASTRLFNKTMQLYQYTDRPENQTQLLSMGYQGRDVAGFEKISAELFGGNMTYNINASFENPDPNNSQIVRATDIRGAKANVQRRYADHLLQATFKYQNDELSPRFRNYNRQKAQWNAWTYPPGIQHAENTSTFLSLGDDVVWGQWLVNAAMSYEHYRREVTANTAAIFGDKINTDHTDNLVAGSLKLSYTQYAWLIPYAKIANAERVPYVNEQYGNNPNGTLAPNPYLDNEKVINYELGIEGSHGEAEYGFSAYYADYTDYIQLTLTGETVSAGTVKQNQNVSNATIQGLEIWGRYKLLSNLNLNAQLTYTHGQNDDLDEPLAFMPPLMGWMEAEYSPTEHWTGALSVWAVAKQDRVASATAEPSTAGYAYLNSRVSYQLPTPQYLNTLKVGFAINNLFDKQYREHLTTPSTDLNYLMPEAGRTYQLNLSATF